LGAEGASSGAALTVGFFAVLRGDQLRNGIAITGVLESSGRIGQVRNIGKMVQAGARQGYRVLLVPRGQMSVPRVKFAGIGVEPNVAYRGVSDELTLRSFLYSSTFLLTVFKDTE
jgi:predicted S18 family serine protease